MHYTFAMVKSDALARGSLSSIILDIHRRGFEIKAEKFRWLNIADIAFLYEAHLGKPYYESLFDSVRRGAYLMVLTAHAAEPNTVVSRWRDHMVGTRTAEHDLGIVGLRGKYGGPPGSPVADNALHGSDNTTSAAEEIAHFFPDFKGANDVR